MSRSRKATLARPSTFYEEVLTDAERMRLPHAAQVTGLDKEIALLRVRLLSHAKEHPEKFDLLLKGVALLVRAVATRYRLSPAAKEDLERSIASVLKGVGEEHGAGGVRGGIKLGDSGRGTGNEESEPGDAERTARVTPGGDAGAFRRLRRKAPAPSPNHGPQDLSPGTAFEVLLQERLRSVERGLDE